MNFIFFEIQFLFIISIIFITSYGNNQQKKNKPKVHGYTRGHANRFSIGGLISNTLNNKAIEYDDSDSDLTLSSWSRIINDNQEYSSHKPSVTKCNRLSISKKFSILSLKVDHNTEGPWYIPSLHDKYSIGWNRTIAEGFLNRPYSCTLRMYGISLEETASEHKYGGSGYLNFRYLLSIDLFIYLSI
jgi:hypothetical protein